MKLFLAALTCLSVSPAFASDHWDNCSNAYGTIKMEYGTLLLEGVGEIAAESVEVKVLSTVKQEIEKCILKNNKTEVIAFDNTTTIEEVKYTIEENEAPMTAILICERGGSGIPANDECE